MTWPLTANMTSHVPMGDNDLWQNYWNFWWWKEALVERHQSPYRTDLLFHPEGAALGLHTNSDANQIWTLPVNALLGAAAALNTALLAGFVFAGFGTYLLARQYTEATGPAFLAGVIFAFFPNHVEHSLEHLNLASLHGLPFLLWALVRTIRHGGHAWIGTGCFFALTCLFGWHNGLLAIPLAAGLAAYETWKGKRSGREILADLVKAATLAALLLAPFLWPMLRDMAEQVGYFRKTIAPRSIDPIFLFIPHAAHPLWGGAFRDLYAAWRSYPSVGFIGYLGYSSLFLACAAFLRPRARAAAGAVRFWLGSTLLFLVLSFGTTLTLAGQEIAWAPLPFRWLQYIPVLGRVRVPHRFLVPAVLSLAILAAIGAGRLLERAGVARRPVLTGMLIGLVALDLLWLPYPVQRVPSPAWVAALDDLPEGLAVLDLPGGHRARGADDMFLQTLHGRPIAGGYVSIPLRHVSRTLREYPVLRRIFQSRSTDAGYSGPRLTEAIRDLEVGIVVVHLDRTPERIRARREEAAREHPGDPYRLLPFNPDQGMPRALLDRFRSELRESFGEPVHVTEGKVEIFLVPDR